MNQKLGRLPPDLYTHIGKKKVFLIHVAKYIM